MNNIYKSKWNESTQTWVACSELARGKCKSNGLKIVAAVALALASTSVIAATSNANNININTDFNSDIKNDGPLSDIDMNINIGESTNFQHFNGNILQAGSGDVNVTIRKHFYIEGDIKSKDTPNSGRAGTLTINNEHGVINGGITNEGSSDITINNSFQITGDITSTETSTGNIIIDNNKNSNIHPHPEEDKYRIISGRIINQGSGAFKIDNKTNLTGGIYNEGAGTITLDNSGTSTSEIKNTGAGTITLDNSGKSTGNIINSSNVASSQIDVINRPDTELESAISNTQAGKIILTNQGKTTGNITNSGAGAITLHNSGTSTSEIKNTGAGTITLDNSGKSTGNIINSSNVASSQIDVTNRPDTELESTISNTQAGKITLTNQGKTTGDITNSGAGAITLHNSGTSTSEIKNTADGKITLDNSGKSTGNIINSGSASSQIDVTNRPDTELESTISNTQAGKITLTNQGKTTGDITNSGAGAITLHNSGTSTSEIKNTGAGTITLDNSGKSTGNIINSSNVASSQIDVTNRPDTELESTISNTQAGKITLTNRGTTTGIITNIGDDSSIHINNEGLLKSKIANMGSGQVTLINSGIGDNTKIINSGDGDITVLNNKTLRNTNIINEMHGTGNISFTNRDKFEGNLINNTDLGLIDATNTDTGTFIGTTGTTNNSGANGKIKLNNQGTWINTENSTLSQLTNTGTIEFSEIPLTDIGDENKYHTITVEGNYIGGGKGKIVVNTLWNDSESDKNGTGYTDRVNIKGDVTGGVTTVTTKNGIYGDITQKEIPITHPKTVIHVEGQITGQGFEGKSVTNNAGEAQLQKIDQSLYGGTGTDYAWTLTAKTPTDPAKPTPPKEVPIYAEPVSGYVQMPTVNMELGFTTIGTLYERRSDNQTYNITGTNNTALADNQQQTWGRILVKHLDKNGKRRLDTVGNQSVLQIGHDFILDENNKTGTRRHIGAYVSYGHNENDFRDQYRAKNGYVVDDHYTGKGRTDAVSVGGYGTFYGNNGGYIDLVGQVSYLRNKYNARSNESVHQNGWGAALSAEAGKSFTVYGNNWFVEPQAQLVYQYLSLDNFNDGIRHVDQHNPSALRGRVGMRFGYNGVITDNLPPSSFYGIANIWHDFVNPKSVDIGRDTLKEEYAKTWGEVGVGIQLPITRQSHFYGDVRYEKNFGSAKRKGFKGTLGYKYTWL
ncbi:autotransporter outer membrane beta-barrel domain-containing protein [Snodgrassella alvi]|uniref:Autotransporter domain-containing protein n=1 Tax=Snodgrassella alvi TaxID=1196083 RepID=A0A2N9XUZ0_9NEIS|nr:autotransporter outer membrane beta-barrel domain-containing protein [Snodgrassella alvi]PIT53316.1 hypothetical protein BHC49_13030 [Snodgrassella alvi]